MIIADTSVWIEFLNQKPPIGILMEEQLAIGNILALECIFGELLQGAKGLDERSIILEYWNNLPKKDEKDLLIKAGVFSSENDLINMGVGIIDVSIAVFAIETKSKIWTLDKKLLNVLENEYIYDT